MRPIFVTALAIFLLFALTMCVPISFRAERAAAAPPPHAQDQEVRVINLEFVGGPTYAVSVGEQKATVRFFSFSSESADHFEMSVQGIRQLRAHRRPEGVYALYFTDAPSVADYDPSVHFIGRFFFNVSTATFGRMGNYMSWLGHMPAGTSIETETITCFIVEEFDDGFRFDPVVDANQIVFSGTSTLP